MKSLSEVPCRWTGDYKKLPESVYYYEWCNVDCRWQLCINDVSSRYEDYKNQTPLMAPCLRLMGIQKIFESLDVQNDDIHYTGCLGSNQGYV